MKTKHQIFRQARHAENEGNWREAESLWNSVGRFADAKTCARIAKVIEEGEAFLQEVVDTLGECPELSSDNFQEFKDWDKKMNEIYKKHFKS